MAHHHLQRLGLCRECCRGEVAGEGGQKHLGVGDTGWMHQNGRTGLPIGVCAGGVQKAVGGAAAFEGIFELEAQALGAQSPQGDEAPVEGQVDHLSAGTVLKADAGSGH
jgi:hypothetical protein